MNAARANRAEWVERIRAWRSSGQNAEQFATGKGYAASTLKWWSYRLGTAAKAPRFLQVVRSEQKAPAQRATDEGLLVEVGLARVRVGRGFDATLLGEVVAALGGAR
jgi:hypothetical protein